MPDFINKYLYFQADFDDQLKVAGDKVVVVDFFATWCGPCKMIAPTLEDLAGKHASSLVVLKVSEWTYAHFDLVISFVYFITNFNLFRQVDVDECEDLAMRYDISSMPTFIFIKNGEKIDSFSGANREKLEKTILQHIGL